ncbi:GPI anchored cell wall [Pyrenophora seminiperda CCB06]|uniref:GPI anchored cell wall n=1 Tax=Pyrenophora seminiperda CCB06 TaxID=1302712 RepID=A0A3M7LVK0_9PLEO|nr:GPI anchored cell wall [Pyrenophora seminiperda CCB06]
MPYDNIPNNNNKTLILIPTTANMLGRTVFAATFFALAQFAVAAPPGCLLGAVNQFNDPSDIKAVCSAKDLKEKVSGICGGDAQAAMEALADICNAAGVKLSAANISSATASAHKSTGTSGSTLVAMYPTGSSSSSGGNSTVPVATGGPKPTAAPTAISGPPQATGAAGKVEFGVAAVVAGLIAAAL